MLQVVVERSFDWSIPIAALAGIGGALIGAATIVLMEAWRRVLDGISASRLLRMEVRRVMTTISEAQEESFPRISLVNPQWSDYASAVAPLLREFPLMALSCEFGYLPEIQDQIDRVKEDPSLADEAFRMSLQNSHDGLAEVMAMLEEMEDTTPFGHVFRVLLGRHRPTEKDAEDLMNKLADLRSRGEL